VGKDHLLRRAGLTALLLLAVGWSPAGAQDAVDFWGAWGSWSGKNAESFRNGYALGASYVADIGQPLDLGLDILFARFDADQLAEVVDEFEVSAVFRRWILGRDGPVQPFLGARVGYTRLAADLADLKFEQNGALGGLVLGFVFPTGRTLSPMLSVEALRLHYGDTTLYLEDLELPQSGGWGWRYFIRGGITFGSGWKRRPR
jgi:hypothetical protein